MTSCRRKFSSTVGSINSFRRIPPAQQLARPVPSRLDERASSLLQVFGFLLCNVLLLEHFGSIDALFKEGRPLILGTFLLVAAAGHARRSLLDNAQR